MAWTMTERMFTALQSIIGRVGALTVICYDADDCEFNMNEAVSALFCTRNGECPAPPRFALDFGNQLYHCDTPITALLGSVTSLCIRNVFLNWYSLASAQYLRRLSIIKTSFPTQRIPIWILYNVLAKCAGTLEVLELDHAVNWQDTNGAGFWAQPPVDLVALKTLSLGYQFVEEAVAVVFIIAIPNVDTLSLRDGARDLLLGFDNDSTPLLYLLARKKEDFDFCRSLSLRNVVYKDVPVNDRERLASHLLRTVCAADNLKLTYDEDLGHNARPFIAAMGVANMAIGTEYLYAQGVDYRFLMQELVRCFVRLPGDDRPRDEAILEPAHVDIVHSDMADPSIRNEFMRYFVASGLESALRVRAYMMDEVKADAQWEPSTQWYEPAADERGVVDWDAYKASFDTDMSVDESMEKVYGLNDVTQLLWQSNLY
ncbi:hypothetical protein PENSPDRAFT_645906 [Peniophora sp. CONT]|nr:hypothetical protein PENSPDRAFT_645906 [Peniophora sp. CONT]